MRFSLFLLLPSRSAEKKERRRSLNKQLAYLFILFYFFRKDQGRDRVRSGDFRAGRQKRCYRGERCAFCVGYQKTSGEREDSIPRCLILLYSPHSRGRWEEMRLHTSKSVPSLVWIIKREKNENKKI